MRIIKHRRSADEDAKKACQNSIYQKGNKFSNIPERNRLVFAIRETVETFVDEFIRTDGGTSREKDLEKIAVSGDDTSLQNMARAILEIRRYLKDPEVAVSPEILLKFLLNNVLLIYVATQDLDDAFRMFTILNDRGVPLRNSDILKSMNLGELEKDTDKTHYAKLWEEAESALGEDFDRFLNYLRTILVKDKARQTVKSPLSTDEAPTPKEKDKATGLKRPPLLKKGKETFQLVERYLKHYNTVRGGANYDQMSGSFQFDNLFKVMLTGLPSTDWVPPLLRYFDRFGHDYLLLFLTKLDNKFSADWIAEYSPTERIENMNKVIRAVEQAASPKELLADISFAIDSARFGQAVEGPVYGRRFARYLLLKLDYFYNDHAGDVADRSAPYDLGRHPVAFVGEALIAHLGGNLVLHRGILQQARFPRRAGERLFAIDVLAVLHAVQSYGRVHEVGNGDGAGVDVFLLFEHRAKISVHRQLFEFLEIRGRAVLVDIAEGHDVFRTGRVVQVRATLAAAANRGDVQLVIKRLVAERAQ